MTPYASGSTDVPNSGGGGGAEFRKKTNRNIQKVEKSK